MTNHVLKILQKYVNRAQKARGIKRLLMITWGSLVSLQTALSQSNQATPEGENSASQVSDSQTQASPETFPELAGMSPEDVIAMIGERLVTLNKSVQNYEKIAQNEGLGSQSSLAVQALEDARHDFNQREYQSALRNLTNYAEWTQVHKIEDYLDASFLMMKAYQEVDLPRKAIRAAARYLSTLATNPEHASQRTIEVMADLLKLVEKHSGVYEIQLNPLMAALTSLELTKEQRAWIYFYTGKSARLTGKNELGIYWLEKSINMSTNQYLIARARYNRSLIYIRMRDFNKAIVDLEAATLQESEDTFDFRQFALLALARINVHLKKPILALNYYNSVQESSDAYAEALFEKTYVYLEAKRFKEANLAAEHFLIRFPYAPNNYQIRTIKAYLDLRNSDLEKAGESLEIGNQRLNVISEWLTENYAKRETLTALDINGIMKVTHAEVEHPPLILSAKSLFERIETQKIRLADLRNDIRNSIYAFGRANADIIKPAWKHRVAQLKELTEDVLKMGDFLIQAETKIYEGRISDRDKYLLEASHKRRMRNYSQPAVFSRNRGSWQDWGLLGEALSKLSSRFEATKVLQADIAALKLLSQTVKVANPESRLNELSELSAQTTVLEDDLLRGVEVVRSRQIIMALGMSALYPLKSLTKSYAETLLEESVTLSAYRFDYTSPQQRHVSDDLAELWGHWQHLLEQSYSQVIKLEVAMGDSLRQRLQDFEELIAHHDQLKNQIEQLDRGLSLKMGSYLGLIMEHYQNRIGARLANHKKWQADLKWLSFDRTTVAKNQSNFKYDLEQQILDENLKDLEQGVLARWP